MKPSAALFAACSLLLSVGCAERIETPALSRRIEGTFVQYEPWMTRLGRAEWRRELDAMRRARIELIVIQWLEFEGVRFFGNDGNDPTRLILEYCDEHDMRVFVGLSHADIYWSRLKDPGHLDRAWASSAAVADEAWGRYGRHRSFAGWYLPQELRDATYPLQSMISIKDFYRKLGDRCRALSGDKPVAIAPAMSGTVSAEKFGHMYATILPGSGIDIVMLQDGVGARGWDNDFERRIVPYFRAMAEACRLARAKLWSDIEVFRRSSKGGRSEPADIERIKRQIAVETPFVERFVMFDFFHYMSPHRGKAQKRLYERYLAEMKNAGLHR